MELSPNKAYAYINKVASKYYQWGNDFWKATGVLEVDAPSLINAKFDALTKKTENYECQHSEKQQCLLWIL